jgi:hypothetical protein
MDYRAYLVNPEGHFESSEIIVADSDDKAVNIAKKLAEKQVVEVWHLDRKIAVLQPDQ